MSRTEFKVEDHLRNSMKKFRFPEIVRNRLMDNFDNNIIDKVQTNITARDTFKYNYKDLLFQVIWCKWFKKKKWFDQHRNNEKYYQKGINKYQQEFDWVEIVQSLRKLKTLVKVMMNEQHQIIQKFTNEGLLNLKPKSVGILEIHETFKNYQNRGMVSDKSAQLESDKQKVLRTLDNYRENGYSNEDIKILSQVI